MQETDLAQWLNRMDSGTLAEVLYRRPDVCEQPAPTTAAQLAQRLLHRSSILLAIRQLDADTVIVAQAIDVLGAMAGPDAIAELLNAEPALVRHALEELIKCGLTWRYEDIYHVVPQALADRWRAPLGLGRSIYTLLGGRDVERCREVAERLGLAPGQLAKADLVRRIEALLTDPRAVWDRVNRLSEPARELLDRMCVESPRCHFTSFGADGPGTELLASGLVVQIDYTVVELPSETAMVLQPRGNLYELTGRPRVELTKVRKNDVRRASTAAAHAALAAVTTLVDDAEHTPIALLKTGGVGPREQKRLAKTLRCKESEVPLWIDLACAGKLLGARGAELVPTEQYDQWRELHPGRRWLVLARAWHLLRFSPTNRIGADGKQVPPPLQLRSDVDVLRGLMLDFLARFEDAAVPVTEVLVWHCPLTEFSAEEIGEQVRIITAEATLLGVLVRGAISPLGRALWTNNPETVIFALPEVKQSVSLQSDLTAVVSGLPTRAVLDVLRPIADPESTNTWRFTPASVRRAFDAGMSAESIIAGLADIAPRGVPQPLEYLINDVARRHGSVRVMAAGCCVVADEALVAEIASTRSLKALRLNQIAPTVLVSAEPVPKTLDALRAAGFMPVGQGEDGVVLIETIATHRTSVPDGPADPATLARQIVANEAADGVSRDTVKALRAANTELPDGELNILADAVETGDPIRVEYHSMAGRHASMVLHGAIFDEKSIIWASCTLRDEEGNDQGTDQAKLLVDRIRSVGPVQPFGE